MQYVSTISQSSFLTLTNCFVSNFSEKYDIQESNDIRKCCEIRKSNNSFGAKFWKPKNVIAFHLKILILM